MANDTSTDIVLKLNEIQKNLKAPKNQFNKFGGYPYRNCEDILQAVKPLLGGAVITLYDSIEAIGDRYYVKATATFTDGSSAISTSAYAREPLSSKGKDEAQVTGSTSSYARKYALNGLLLIDDNKDPDTQDNSEPKPHPNSKQAKEAKAAAQESHPVASVIAGFLADGKEHPFALESWQELNEEEKKEIWSLLNHKQKETLRALINEARNEQTS